MWPVVIEALVLASAGVGAIGSITLVTLLLTSGAGWRNGLGYAVGYTGAYIVLGLAVVLVGNNSAAASGGGQGRLGSTVIAVLGVVLLVVGLRNARRPHRGNGESGSAGWVWRMVDGATPVKSLGVGALVSIINVKNLAIFLSAISVLHLSNLVLAEKLAGAVLVALVFCLSVILPVLIRVLLPRASRRALTWTRRALETHRRGIGIWVPLVFGVMFLSCGIGGLQ
jgi:hypothetical protein